MMTLTSNDQSLVNVGTLKRIVQEHKMYEKSGSIEKHYGLTDKRFKIKRNQLDNGDFVFEMSFIRKGITYPLSKKINKYILNHINEFITETFTIKFLRKCPYDFPFKPPMWTIKEVDCNIMKNVEIYFKYILDERDAIYASEWSPAIGLPGDLLDIIVNVIDGIKYIFKSENKVMHNHTEVPRTSNVNCLM